MQKKYPGTVTEFLEANKDYIKIGFDNQPLIRDQLLAVNLALFGNFIHSGECSLDYFLKLRNINPPDLIYLVRSLLYQWTFGFFTESLADKFNDFFNNNPFKDKAILLQLFIPNELIDSCVYLSKPFGIPYSESLIDEYWDTINERHTTTLPIINMLYHTDIAHPIYSELFTNDLQARIVMNKEFLNPDNGIKIFRYHAPIDPQEYAQYKERLDELVDAIIKESTTWLGKAYLLADSGKRFYKECMAHKKEIAFYGLCHCLGLLGGVAIGCGISAAFDAGCHMFTIPHSCFFQIVKQYLGNKTATIKWP